MIKKWSVSEFKAFKNKIEFEFRENVLLCGANSSGKSSLIQSILLIAQTNSSRLADESIVLNGHLTQLGSFRDLKNDLGGGCIEIGFTLDVKPFEPAERRHAQYSRIFDFYDEVRVTAKFGLGTDGREDSLNDIYPDLLSCKLRLRDKSGRSYWIEINKNKIVREDKHDVSSRDVEKFESFGRYSVQFDPVSSDGLKRRYGENLDFFGAKISRALPTDVAVSFDSRHANSNAISKIMSMDMERINPESYAITIPSNVFLFLGQRLKGNGPYRNLSSSDQEKIDNLINKKAKKRDVPVKAIEWIMDVSSLEGSLSRIVSKVSREHEEGIKQVYVRSLNKKIIIEKIKHPLIDAARFCTEYLGQSIKYLGPLRDEPRALYPLSPLVDPVDVGLRGENTAAVYSRNKDKIVKYVPPEMMVSGDYASQEAGLKDAALEWLKYIGVTEEISSEQKGKLGYEVKVRPLNSSKSHDLTHVGVGISQVLPIVVMSLLANSGDIIIFEQPELHLHPKMQARLADFFLSLSARGVQVIIETHSEYIIDRYRFRVAISDVLGFEDKTIIYFLSLSESDVDVEKMNINEYGRVSNWPIDFFDQSVGESQNIIAAAARKKKKKIGGDND